MGATATATGAGTEAGERLTAAEEMPEAVRRAFEAPRLTIGELADRLGIPRGTLAGYIIGKRRTPAPIARRLAAVLRQHAEELAAIAGTLEEAKLEEAEESTAPV